MDKWLWVYENHVCELQIKIKKKQALFSLLLMVYSQKSHSLAPNQLENSVRLADLQKKILSVVAITYFIKKIIY